MASWLNSNPVDPADDDGSDSSDEDYKPGGESEVSEEEGDGEPEEGPPDDAAEGATKTTGKRRKKQTNGKNRRGKMLVLDGAEEEHQAEEAKRVVEDEAEKKRLDEEEEKRKADKLFADFMTDVGGPRPRPRDRFSGPVATPPAQTSSASSTAPASSSSTSSKDLVTAGRTQITKLFDFAGEQVKVTENVDSSASPAAPGRGAVKVAAPSPRRGRGGGGLSSLVGSLGQKPARMSVLQKTALDWNHFKEETGATEELQKHCRSKDAYLEKQDFLQRTDQRQFEQEKSMRDRHRTPRT